MGVASLAMHHENDDLNENPDGNRPNFDKGDTVTAWSQSGIYRAGATMYAQIHESSVIRRAKPDGWNALNRFRSPTKNHALFRTMVDANTHVFKRLYKNQDSG